MPIRVRKKGMKVGKIVLYGGRAIVRGGKRDATFNLKGRGIDKVLIGEL